MEASGWAALSLSWTSSGGCSTLLNLVPCPEKDPNLASSLQAPGQRAQTQKDDLHVGAISPSPELTFRTGLLGRAAAAVALAMWDWMDWAPSPLATLPSLYKARPFWSPFVLSLTFSLPGLTSPGLSCWA